MTGPLFRCRGLTVRYDRRAPPALDGLSLALAAASASR